MKNRKRLFMETTKIAAQRTANEIMMLLIRAGATQISQTYKAGNAVSLMFSIEEGGKTLCFDMPVRVSGIIMKLNPHSKPSDAVMEKAERIAWRQLLRWTEAQLAFVDSGMAKTHEVFLPYLLVGDEITVFQMFEQQKFKALPEMKK